GGGLFQDLDLAVDTQNLRHLLLELGVASFQVVAHLVRLDVLLAEDLAQRALDQMGETFVPCRRSALARMTGQKAASSTARADSRAPWPYRTPEIPTRL